MNIAFYCLPEAMEKSRDAAFPYWSLQVSNIDLVSMTLRSSHQLDVTVDRQVQQGVGRGGMQGTVAHTRAKAGHC